jgi:hypothetical protein
MMMEEGPRLAALWAVDRYRDGRADTTREVRRWSVFSLREERENKYELQSSRPERVRKQSLARLQWGRRARDVWRR